MSLLEYAVISTNLTATITINETEPSPLMMVTLVTVGPMSWDVEPREILTSKLFAQSIKIEKTGRRKVSVKGTDLLCTLCYLTESSPLFLHNLWSNMGRFPFNQKFRKSRTGAKWYRSVLGKFPENPETVEFPKSEPTENSRNSGRKVKWNENSRYETCENFGIPRKVCLLFPEIMGSAVPSVIGNFRKIKPECFIEWKAPFVVAKPDKC